MIADFARMLGEPAKSDSNLGLKYNTAQSQSTMIQTNRDSWLRKIPGCAV
jgi:hypothetical protein